MPLNDIRQVLQHWYRRQTESGPATAFRFSLFIGPRRKQLFALYPDPSNPGPSTNLRRKADKGKRREDALQGLLQIDESVERLADPAESATQSRRNPTLEPTQSNQQQSETRTSADNDFVRIDMEQMLQLKGMGYEPVGPVNGPNEGYPEYVVPKELLHVLQSRSQFTPTPSQDQVAMTIEPEPALDCIDPLLGRAEQDGQTNDTSHTSVLPPDVGSTVRSTTPPNADADSAHNTHNKTPQQRLGKRVQANLSPQTNRQQRKSKKKKITADDRAAMEAENMVQSGSRQRKATRRQ
jgi:hypothetical protein